MKLSIILINFNTAELTTQAVNSIKTRYPHEIIIVDNHSKESDVTKLESLTHTNLIKNSKNLGFGAANNQAIASATGEYLLLLNSDAYLQPDTIDLCLKYLDQHPQVGILTPKIVLSTGTIDPACHRGMPTIFNSLCYFLGLERLFPHSKLTTGYHQLYKGYTTTHPVDAVSGAVMFIRAKMLSQIGAFDEQFFMYAEDLDLCFRAKQKGWQIIYYPKATATHFKGASGTQTSNPTHRRQSRTQFYHTMKLFYDKHYQHFHWPVTNRLVHFGIDLLARLKT